MKSRLELTNSREGESLVIWVMGDFDLAGREPVLDAATPALIDGKTVVLDLSRVTFIDASGLGTLATCSQTAIKSGGGFSARRAREQVACLLKLTGLADLLLDETT